MKDQTPSKAVVSTTGLHPHPRLFVGPEEQLRTTAEPSLPFLQRAAAWVVDRAEEWSRVPDLTYRRNTHNEFLGRAREVQTRVVTLLTRWQQTQDERFRRAVLDHIGMMGEWECWSWISWRRDDYRPEAIYDLSYGENSATLAIAYDWLFDTLSAEEKELCLGIALKWSFASATVHLEPGNCAWWYGRPDSNWNTVCAGGLGLLCLAMYEDVEAARLLLPRVESSFEPYMKHLDETNGAWPEGVGYWNYGMHYAFIYLLSWQNATGNRHPLLELNGAKQTLSFPLDFCPNGQPCSFGDVNHWSPLPTHYAVARDLGAVEVMQAIDGRILAESEATPTAGGWGASAMWLWFHEGTPSPEGKGQPFGVKLYEGLDWGVIADRLPHPNLYLSVRGGTTEVPHGHNDLLSFSCVIGKEKLIPNIGNAEYLDTTFSSRRYELPDINAQYKNSILVNGVGVFHGGALERTEVVEGDHAVGLRLEATSAMGMSRDGAAAEFCGRLFLLLDDKAFLVVDRLQTRHPARMESRLHTLADTRIMKVGAQLSGEQEALRISYAANVPALLATAMTAPTTPTAPSATMLRWCTQKLHTDVLMATLLTPGRGKASITVSSDGEAMAIRVSAEGLEADVRVSSALEVSG